MICLKILFVVARDCGKEIDKRRGEHDDDRYERGNEAQEAMLPMFFSLFYFLGPLGLLRLELRLLRRLLKRRQRRGVVKIDHVEVVGAFSVL